MIAYLEGKVLLSQKESLIVQANGQSLGHEIFVPTYEMATVGQTVKLWVHSHIREDAFTLFGFSSFSDKDVFLCLLKVNGIGPRLALSILSSCRGVKALAQWVDSKDITSLSSLPRVGKKKAEQICLTLKGKLPESPASELSLIDVQIEQALKNLGFKSDKITRALGQSLKSKNFNDRLREVLAQLNETSP